MTFPFRFLIDVGCGSPCHFAIPLDFADSSRIHTDGFLVFKLKWEKGTIHRYHARHKDSKQVLCPSELASVHKDDIEWEFFYDFSEGEMDAIRSSIRCEYEDLFLRRWMALRFLDDKMCGLRDGHSEETAGCFVYFEYSAEGRSKTIITSEEDLYKTLQQLLPHLDEQVIQRAITHRKHYATSE